MQKFTNMCKISIFT